MFPLKKYSRGIPSNDEGSFSKIRKLDRHTGVDLYVSEGTSVYSIEDGIVVGIEDPFTGPEGDSDLNEGYKYLYTKAVLIEGESGVVCYGEVDPSVQIGDTVSEGEVVGSVMAIFAEGHKGECESSMLHFELYRQGTTEAVWWQLNEAQPLNLLNPTSLLRKLRDH